MKWEDEGIVVSLKNHGESNLIVTFFTKYHGRYNGFLRKGKKTQFECQLGVNSKIWWNARLSEHLGIWKVETLYNPIGVIFNDRLSLYALKSACNLIQTVLPERSPEKNIYNSMKDFVYALMNSNWFLQYINFELTFLESLGFELRNVNYSKIRFNNKLNGSYSDKLYELIKLLENLQKPTVKDFVKILSLISFFLEYYVFSSYSMKAPKGRIQFLSYIKTSLSKEK